LVGYYSGYLWAMRPDGADLVNLTKPVAYREPFEWAWSPDGSKIAFMLNQDFAPYDLWTVRPDGDLLVRLNPTTGVAQFAWAPDGSRILYLARNPGGPLELFSVRPDASGHTRLNRDLPSGGAVLGFWWAAVSSRIMFLAQQDAANLRELFSVRPDGTDLVKLNGPLFVPPGVLQVRLAPDSSRIAYTIMPDQHSTQIQTVRPDGSGRVGIDTGNLSLSGIQPWSSDGFWLLYPSDVGLRVALSDVPGSAPLDPVRTVSSERWVP
jgi:dipeptidyl aminopeptidase/acylaminoacyl peptidase